MSLDATALFALLPPVYRTRDALAGGPLQALMKIAASQFEIVEDNIEQLYDDQFIETCMPWVIPYIGDLIGYNSIYQIAAGLDSRAEVANTIGARRRKGTSVCLQQVAVDVSGRPAIVVEEFRRIITTQSLRLPRPHHVACVDLRRNDVLDTLDDTAFDRSNRTFDVRRIAPRVRNVALPDPAPLDIGLHGPGRFNVPDVAVHLWRCQPWKINGAPAFGVDARRFRFNPLGLDIPLFSVPQPPGERFKRIHTRADVPQPIGRGEFRRNRKDFYGRNIGIDVDGVPVPVAQIVCANLADRADGSLCIVPAGKIALDPELGRIQFAADLAAPASVRVSYAYGFAAALGGGPYDRSTVLAGLEPTVDPATAGFFAQIGTSDYPDLASAVAQWNQQAAGTIGFIVLPGYERYAIDLTGPGAIALGPGSVLVIVSAVTLTEGGPRAVEWNGACATLRGDLEVHGSDAPPLPNGDPPPAGQLVINGVLVEGQLTLSGATLNVQLSDCTFVPGLGASGDGLSQCEPSVVVTNDTTLCVARCISGPLAASATASVRVTNCIVDANSPCCVAYAGADGYSAGADLHIEDSTVIGKVRTRTLTLASNTIFFARTGRRDPWPAALWCSRRQTGCVRFCVLPLGAITPRRYECLPPDIADPADVARFAPAFITLRYGQPGYALLSGDVPLAIWQGADNGSQIGAYYCIQETEAVANVQIRLPEYLPVLLEGGVFVHPSRTLPRAAQPPFSYYGGTRPACCGDTDDMPAWLPGIGAGLL